MTITGPTFRGATIKDDVVARSVGDEMVLLDLESGTYFTLNAVGALIWRGLENSDSLATIIERIGSEYEVSPERAESDTADLIGQLIQKGLLAEA